MRSRKLWINKQTNSSSWIFFEKYFSKSDHVKRTKIYNHWQNMLGCLRFSKKSATWLLAHFISNLWLFFKRKIKRKNKKFEFTNNKNQNIFSRMKGYNHKFSKFFRRSENFLFMINAIELTKLKLSFEKINKDFGWIIQGV